MVEYFDDILIFSRSVQDHVSHVEQVLAVLRAERLFINKEKYSFMKESVKFLGFIISNQGVKVGPAKFHAVQSWPTPHNFLEVRVSMVWPLFIGSLFEISALSWPRSLSASKVKGFCGMQ